ncbi:MAG: helix-turn-helix domain-containing protein [Treponema sp.]|nr:helix-turn-helix domain-containing protein [Treponema sp.]
MDTIDDFWERVNKQLRAHKISRKKFAEFIDVPYSTFNSWLRNGRSLEVYTAYNIAAALGVNLEFLLTGIDGKNARERLKQIEERKTVKISMEKLIGKMRKELVKL